MKDSSEKSADMLFNALAEFSEKSKISFLVNYHSVEEEEIMGEKKPVITKCKENFFSKKLLFFKIFIIYPPAIA